MIPVGNVGKNPEVRYSPSGTPVATFCPLDDLLTNKRALGRDSDLTNLTQNSNAAKPEKQAATPILLSRGSRTFLRALQGALNSAAWTIAGEQLRPELLIEAPP
jgi:hypothetical protein